MEAFIRRLPKAELHLHIEGTLGPETILDLAARNGVEFPYRSVEEIEHALASRPPGLVGFLDHHSPCADCSPPVPWGTTGEENAR